MHDCEPSMKELREICAKLYASESTDENMKKIRAVEAQIARREAAQPKKAAAAEVV